MARDDFSEVVKLALAKRVGFLCSNPDCGALTVGPNTNAGKATLVGVAAHITAAATGGPRYNPLLSPEQRKHPDNGIWLCQTCGKRVDSDEEAYPETTLRQWKRRAEAAAWTMLGKTAPPGTFSSAELVGALSTHVPDEDVQLVLREGMRRLSAMLPNKKLSVHGRGQQLVMEITDADPTAGPRIVSFIPKFPETPEGVARRRAFEEFLLYGTPVELLSTDIPFDELPEEIQTIAANQPQFHLRLGPSRSSRPMLVALRFEAESGRTYELPYLDLRVVAGGSERVETNNVAQPIPFKFSIAFMPSGAADIQWSFELQRAYVFWFREFLRFKSVLESPTKVVVTALDDGLQSTASIMTADQSDPVDPAILDLLDRVLHIQQKTGTAIRLPDRPILDQADVDAIAWIEHVLSTGTQPTPPSDFRITVYDRDDQKLIERLREHPLHIRSPRHTERLLDTDVDLGPVVVTCPRIDLIFVGSEEVSGRKTFEYKIVPQQGYHLHVQYERYSSGAEPTRAAASE